VGGDRDFKFQYITPKRDVMCHVTSLNFVKQVITVQDRDIVVMEH